MTPQEQKASVKDQAKALIDNAEKTIHAHTNKPQRRLLVIGLGGIALLIVIGIIVNIAEAAPILPYCPAGWYDAHTLEPVTRDTIENFIVVRCGLPGVVS